MKLKSSVNTILMPYLQVECNNKKKNPKNKNKPKKKDKP